MTEPPIIEHNPNEKRPTNTIWWVLWPMIGLLWAWYLYFFDFNWPALALGVGTGLMLATWAIEITGNKTPDWMTGRRRRR